ncbi:midasin [Rhizopus microsporus ATCC 52813]|uniref:Midasin n=1 Tax=Rhizopus microsporus ATCC 52813 TaxID=1340429 RepID=A0A2G4SY58_RHIZD|nr:midasin [Rhizopus microsporus ATCC 52813]PHZ13684.1 midasin [Rhizopus microsporus ATCC 52813]
MVEATEDSIFDPLSFDFLAAVQQLSAYVIEQEESALDAIIDHEVLKNPNSISRSNLLDLVSRAMINPSWTLTVVRLFRPIVIDLIGRWTMPGFTTLIETALSKTHTTVHTTELIAKAFSVILPIAPQVKNLAVLYFTHSTSLFERLDHYSNVDSMDTSTSSSSIDNLHDLLLTTYRLLSFSAVTFSPIWNWGPVVQLLKYPDTCVRYITTLCLCKVYNLSDSQQNSLLSSIVGKPLDESDEPIYMTIEGSRVDIRFLDLWEQQRLADNQIAYLTNNFDVQQRQLEDSDLCPSTCNLCGVLLTKRVEKESDRSSYNPELVLTKTTSKNLHAISLALSIGAPTLLEGVTGAGKTCLVEELAWRTGRGAELVKIHLGDQTDPKVLLGTYVSTSTPGSFRWQAGVLTTAVLEGRWVLIEDIDLAPAEVLSVLLPLLETGHLFIPSRGEKIKAKEGFQMFGTRSFLPSRSGKGVTSRGASMMTGANLWTRVHVEPLSHEELELVIRQKFTHINDFASHAMNLFQTVVDLYEDTSLSLSSSSMGRFLSTRDLMKWCHRVDLLLGEKLNDSSEVGMDLTLRQDLFNEANDCFCGMIPDYNIWMTVLQTIGKPLQISQELVRNYVDQYKPVLDVNDTHVRIGRVNLSSIAASGKQKKKAGLIKREKQRPFATTGHALRLMEKIAVSIHLNEPVLLVGETGTGKTTVVQHLADMIHQNLIVVNLSQQSDSSDLLGGFKPVDGKVLAIPLNDEFERLFEKTFSVKKNIKFLDMVRKMFIHQKWTNFVALLKQAIKMSQQKFEAEQNVENKKTSSPQLRNAWKTFTKHVEEFEVQQVQSQNKFVFSFMEGSLVKAVRQGDWILLDEINLATTETLECLSGLLQDVNGSLLLTEKGDVEPIKRHPNFRLFACMNPATDVGKRDLPPGLRNRFTEFYVHPPDNRYDDLLQIVKQYLYGIAAGDERCFEDVADFYTSAKKLANEHKLVDGANQRPHFSMRTLARALTYVVQISPTYGLRRSLYEGFCMTFLTQLDKESETVMHDLIYKTILRNIQNPQQLITRIPRQPAENYIQFGHFWLEQGQFPPEDDPRYILTNSIETKLYNLARVIMSRKFPVLIQGPTSAGKTSMVEYMAKKTGHRFVRINNHEHTDLQEYLGTYVSNNEGKLVFQEGVLVEALRNGYWIVLDELNLAPSDVLEALNRLLDDNRELLIPETQEIVKPHPHFMLFATQNPAGLYGGRKALSRAFRNRFLELHFDDIPEDELETILSNRCKIAPSYCKKLVKVYKDLMAHRQSTRIFEQKHGFITLRDLFRWAGRDPQGYQELAENGYMLLAERCRRDEEKKVVKQVLEQVMKVKLDENEMYDCNRLEEFQTYDRLLKERSAKAGEDNNLVWTKAMRRLFSLVARCLRYDEPVLLVGDTGCGKTTVCQMLAETYGRELHIVNCHQNTETSDLLGGQRPVRGQDEDEDMDKPKHLFEWHDGPLVQSMKDGHLFLLDEISLADDSVLERLNSVLEPSRLLVLAEKGGKQVEELYAAPGFKFLATMNPGGDYGKKELSPALRNRFTEIWVPSVTDREDLISIIDEQMKHATLKGYSERMLDFISWYSQALGQSRTVISLRDILSWVKFMNTAVDFGLNPELSFAHGACIVLLDGLGSHGSSSSFMTGSTLKEFRLKCLRHLSEKPNATEQEVLGESRDTIVISDNKLAIGPFEIPRGKLSKANVKFTLSAPTTSDNAMRVVRAMQLRKPILLEGSPGVGKTSLISALAAASGHNLVRINLSEQTDLMDLFGSDLPVEGGNSGEFAWRDAPFLQAMKAGDWVLLDELNLASQSVLEGLNSCLDHRGAVYIPELDREFFCDKEFRVFGAQNPLQQGGGRKGLPKSFINRFTQVYVEQLSPEDLLFICSHLFPEFEPHMLAKMIEFNNRMYEETMIRCTFGRKGSPWEFNLRDVFRWLELMRQNHTSDPAEYLDIIYMQRMRSADDRIKVIQLFETAFNVKYDRPEHPLYEVTVDNFTVGHSRLARKQAAKMPDMFDRDNHILQSFLPSLQSLMKCVESGWMAILTGPSASGKTSLVRLLSKMTGNVLQEFAMNSSVDTMELLGGFEQVDLNRHRQVVMDMLHVSVSTASKSLLLYAATLPTDNENYSTALQLIRQLNDAMYVLNSKQQMKLASSDAESAKLDYALVSNVVSYLKSASAVDQELHNSISSLNTAVDNLQELEKDTVAGKFEWIDGLLINALEHGHWLLIDNANLCNPSVLDRLNPLFENDGVLMVNERGLVDGTVKVIKPHPNFRMFMTVDPQNGELSRAMRNRGIEIALLDSNWNKNDQDATKLVNSLGVRGRRIPALLNELQGEVTQSRKHLAKSENVRDYLMFATYMAERLQRGQSLKSAIRDSFFQVFVDIENAPSALAALLENDVASQELLQELVSPTNSPFFIGGKLFQNDSNLATIALHGAYFVYLLQTLDTDDEESQKKIDVAADYLLENLNLQNYGLCYRWLGYMSQHTIASKSAALEKIGHLMKNLIKHPLFTELTNVQLKSKSVAVNHEELKCISEAYKMLIRLLKQDYIDNTMRSATQRLKVGNLTALQQSYCFQVGRLSESQLLHPVVPRLYPFFEAINSAVASWIDQASYRNCTTQIFEAVHHVLDVRDYTWSLTHMEALSLDKLLISIRIMKELITTEEMASVGFNTVLNHIEDIMSGFDFDTSRSMMALWGHFHPSTLSSEPLHMLESDLRKISNDLNCYRFSLEEGLKPKSLVLHAKSEAKRTLIEGIATLYAVDVNNAATVEQTLKSLRNLPEYITRELQPTEASDTIRRDSSWDAALVPLHDYSSILEEMEILAKLYFISCDRHESVNDKQLLEQMSKFKEYAINYSSRPPTDLVPYQRLIWFLDCGKSINTSLIPGLIQDAAYTYHQRLWRSSVFQKDLFQLVPNDTEKDLRITEGSLALYESVETFICLNMLGSVDKMPVDAFESALKQLKGLQQFLSNNTKLKDRRLLEVATLFSMTRQLLNASAEVLDEAAYEALSSVLNKAGEFSQRLLQSNLYFGNDVTSYYADVAALLDEASQVAQQYEFNSHYIGAINALRATVESLGNEDKRTFFSACGKARVLLGLAFLSAYIPDYPVDPTSEPRLRVDLLLQKKQKQLNNINVRENIEKIYTGNDTNSVIDEEKRSLEKVNDELGEKSTVFSLRPAQSQLDEIFVDLRYLQKSMLEHNVENLLNELETHCTDSILQREALLQGNALQFVDRVFDKFPLYRDILQPLVIAVDDIKYGLRMLTVNGRRDSTDEFLSEFIELLIREPDITGHLQGLTWNMLATPQTLSKIKAIVFERAPTNRKWAFYLRLLIVILQRTVASFDTAGYLKDEDLVTVNALFSEIIQVWKSAEEYKNKLEAEKEALYKTRAKKYEPPTEEELEEEDLKNIFADFNDEFADLTIEDDTPPKKVTDHLKVEEVSVLDNEDVHRIGHLHKLIFTSYKADACSRLGKPFNREALQSYTTANQLASMAKSPFTDVTDRICNAGHLRVANLAIRRLESENSFATTSDDIYDFYQSENVHEAKKVEPVVNRFKARVLELAEQWPEHAILEQLLVICDRILTFSILSPVAKFLTGIELLLQKSEDWEAYAAKHVSLKSQRDELIALIVNWRQLELNCWPKLLAAQEQYHQNAAFKWWFHLYDTINNTSFDTESSESCKKTAHELLSALDQFMQTSSIAEYQPRLQMIDTFYQQAKLQAQFSTNESEQLSFEKTAVILRNVYLYYSQFQQHVDTMLTQMRKPIEKDLKDFVKIATWKDVNIYALRQSAVKTHRKLHKCICKYREVLNTSMLTVIANYNGEHAMYQYGDDKRYAKDINRGLIDQLSQPKLWISETPIKVTDTSFDWSASLPVKKHLANLPVTLNRLHLYCQKDVFINDAETNEAPLEDFMTEMINKVKQFQKETPSVLTDENKSTVMNQKQLKKKALVDFLKELRRLGLKSRATTMRESNSDSTALFLQNAAKLELLEATNNLQKLPLSICSGATQDIIEQWNKANDYYYRCVARLTHLRTISTTNVSRDLSMLEVERSMSAAEHMFLLVRKERHLFAQMENRIQILQGVSVQLAALYDAFTNGKLIANDGDIEYRFIHHKAYVDKLALLMKQAVELVSIQASSATQGVLKDLQTACADVQKVQRTVDYWFVQRYLYPRSATSLDFSLMSIDIDQLIKDNMNKLDPIETVLASTSQALPQSSHTLYSIIQFISNARATAAMVDSGKAANAELTMTDLRERVHALIDAVLISIQDLKKANSTVNPAKSEEDDDNENMPQNYICFQSEKQAILVSALHLESASRRCVELLTTAHVLVSHKQDDDVVCEISRLLQEVYPFLQQYMLVVQHTLAKMLIHHKSMAKFTYCLVNTFSIIITKGFCMPEGAEDAEEGDAEGTQAGTGIGEGEGTKDVSHEIEDEEQVLGTQNEERSNDDKQDTKEEKEGMDMENDFDGNLEDVEQEEQDNEESESSEDEEEEPDEQIGDVDDMDPDAVDDKMWGDEQDENLNESDKTVDDQGKQETQKDSDIVAKEESEEQSESKNEKSEAPENQDDQQQEQDNNEEQGDEGDEGDADEEREAEGEDEDDVENRPGEQLNAEIPEAETLDLPEDLNMEGDDEDQEEGGEDDMGMNDPMDIDELPNQEQLPEEEEGEAFHDALDHVDEGKEGEENENMPDGDQMDHTEEKKEGEEDEALPDNEQMDQENSKTSNAQIEEEEESEQTESTAQNREQPNSDATADNQFGVQGQAGKQSKSTSGKNDGEEDLADTAQGEDDNTEKKESKGKSGSGSNDVNNEEDETEDNAEESEANEAQSNPQRSLGDALEKWRRRLENVEEAGTEEEENDEVMKTEDEDTENAQVNDKDTFEYVKNDEEAHDMQTMGNAQPDQIQDLKAAAMDEEQEDDAGVSGEMEVDQQEESIDTMPLPRETLDMAGAADRQGAILSKRLPENQIVDETEILTVDESVVSREPLEKQDIEHMRDELEAQVSEWREEGRDINKARELWQGYENLTHDLAMGLCEQLRLILEPTLATKLKGDYRTGKRLNMKKIIPYIASQFKKDKIWLRRTKLSKRQYQVMISVDDSKSMSESRSVQLAYETLALISKALSQLEVGDISISSFGERVRLLHPFGQPFTSESGANVIQQFTFAQQKTYVKNLIETSLGLFENAKYSSGSGAAELWQLQLIISDGICEDHETLRALVRSALEQRIMIIFIVVDNKPEKDSILNMTNITYTIKDGKYGIQMKPYLETFPFQYFMIVRDVSSLPEALSDALRQYFSFVSS